MARGGGGGGASWEPGLLGSFPGSGRGVGSRGQKGSGGHRAQRG